MTDKIRTISTFIKRDFMILSTYGLAITSMVLSTIFNLFYLALFGSMFKENNPSGIAMYGGGFISYMLVGSIGWSFLWSIVNATSSALSDEMKMGTLESIMQTKTSITTLIIAYTLSGCIFGAISTGIIFAAGYFFFGIVAYSDANIYTLVIFFLSILLMIGFGMIFGGLTLWMKDMGQTVPLIQTIVMFFSGVYFPITVLPEFFQPVAKYIPFYYSIEGLRISLVPTIQAIEIMKYIWILSGLSILFFFVGLYILHKGLNKAKKDGSLAFY